MYEPIKMWCDGGCRGNQMDENIGAWGVYITYKDYVKELSNGAINTTNNIMELTACIEGLKAIKKKSIPVIVYLDSAYVLNGITNWINVWKANGWITSKKQPVLNKNLWIELDTLKSQFDNIEFKKVKGHSNNYGNIQADRLCNEYMNKLDECLNELKGE